MEKNKLTRENSTITITFGDRGENHAGMQIIGQYAPDGFSYSDLRRAEKRFQKHGAICELIDLRPFAKIDDPDIDDSDAFILIVRNGVNIILKDDDADDLFNEQAKLTVDTKALMRGRVVNKIARHNLCFATFSQEPDYENGKGRIINFNSVPLTNSIRQGICKYLKRKGEEFHPLIAEGNYYYDVNECYISYHGDFERRRVIAIRLGQKMNLIYHWYKNGEQVGDEAKFYLDHGDLYIMGAKAVGQDWKKRSIYTLRHCAGKKFD